MDHLHAPGGVAGCSGGHCMSQRSVLFVGPIVDFPNARSAQPGAQLNAPKCREKIGKAGEDRGLPGHKLVVWGWRTVQIYLQVNCFDMLPTNQSTNSTVISSVFGFAWRQRGDEFIGSLVLFVFILCACIYIFILCYTYHTMVCY